MELIVIPFLVCCLTIPLVYKFLTPLFSGGKVVLKQIDFLQCMLFGLAMTIAFVPAFAAIAIGTAMLITPFVSSFVNSASETAVIFISGAFRLLLAQLVFFVLTLLAGRILKKLVTVDGKFAAWRAAWAPALVFVTATIVLNYALLRMYTQ